MQHSTNFLALNPTNDSEVSPYRTFLTSSALGMVAPARAPACMVIRNYPDAVRRRRCRHFCLDSSKSVEGYVTRPEGRINRMPRAEEGGERFGITRRALALGSCETFIDRDKGWKHIIMLRIIIPEFIYFI
jgi:hypothetical protein